MKLAGLCLAVCLLLSPWRPAFGATCLNASALCFDGVLTPTVSGTGILKLQVENLAPSQAASIRLILNDLKFAAVPDLRQPNVLSFHIADLASDPNKNWTKLICPLPLSGTMAVTIALSGPDGTDIAVPVNAAEQFTLTVFDPARLLAGLAAALAVAAGVVALARRTGMLRNPPDPGQGSKPAAAEKDRPWSLARCQMAFWFVLIFMLFVILWAATGSYNNIITSQSLTLMGISAAAGAGGVAIDNSRPENFSFGPRESFFKDILKDANGWVFHRLQMFIWTLVLGLISIWSVWNSLTLPSFDDNLLLLMGISSGLYLGCKLPEPSTPDKPKP